MQHPFERLAQPVFARLYLGFFVATLVVAWLMLDIGDRFGSIPGPDGTKYGMVELELAWSPELFATIKSVWGPEGTAIAVWQTVLDYLFLFVYGNAIALGCVALASCGAWPALGRALAWGGWASALLDAIENACLIAALRGEPAAPLPQLAAACAGVKFALVLAALLYLLGGLGKVYRAR